MFFMSTLFSAIFLTLWLGQYLVLLDARLAPARYARLRLE